MTANADWMARLAELAVRVGANVQPDQVVTMGCQPGQVDMARQVADAAYRAGARFVDVVWHDPVVKRSRVRHAPQDTLGWVPPWYTQRAVHQGDTGGATIALSGPTAPGVFDDVDPARLALDRLPSVREQTEAALAGKLNWTVVPCPTPAWAAMVHPGLAPEAALDLLWADIAHVCRLDTDDPVRAWRERAEQIVASADALNRRRIDALHFVGPGTDLTVGLFGGSRWLGGTQRRPDGLEHLPNIPTEEVFTTPDPRRTEGVVSATMPLELAGTLVEGLRVTFREGRAVDITADRGAEVLRGRAATDEGAARLGEVALVDGSGRIGPLGRVFLDTLLDENAASHIALGGAYPAGVDGPERELANVSDIHIDFMIGGPEVTVSAVAADGTESPLLRRGEWVAAG
ncbi:MAG: aminopeptidase [Thermoleophilia bacterium]